MPKLAPIGHAQLARIFVADGWTYKRTKGDHDCYVKPGFIRPVVIPHYDPCGLDIITSNMRTANMTRERYFELLATC
jgi:predicted RNA binding protein YcfA (HicA-like mRNA interferase family)